MIWVERVDVGEVLLLSLPTTTNVEISRKITNFLNRRCHIFKWLEFSIVMLLFAGVLFHFVGKIVGLLSEDQVYKSRNLLYYLKNVKGIC